MTILSQIASEERVASAAYFGWFCRTKAVASWQGGNLANAAQELNAPPEIMHKIKAAAETTTTQQGLAGSSVEVSAFVSQAAETSVLLRMIADRASYPVPLRTAVYLPQADMTAAIVGEGRPIPIQNFTLDRFAVDSFKIGGALVVTDELLRNTSAAGQAFLNTQLRSAVALASDQTMFNRLTHSGTVDLDTDGTAAQLLPAIRGALDAVSLRATDQAYFAFSPAAANWIATTAGLPEGSNPFSGTFLARPAIITEALTGRRIAAVNARAVVGAVDQVEIAASNAGTIEFAATPLASAITPTPVQMVSLFQNNSTAIKIVLHLAVESIRADGVAFVNIDAGASS